MATQGPWASAFGEARWPAPTYRRIKPKEEDKDNGVVSFMKNLVNDVSDAVTGIPMGLKTIFSQSPTKTGKAIGLSFWQDWSPLLKGDTDEWWDNFTAHPLAPILDIVGLATFGAGTAVKGAASISKVSKMTDAGGVVLRETPLTRAIGKVGGVQTVRIPAGPGGYIERTVVGRGSKRTINAPGVPEVDQFFHANPFVRARQLTTTRIGQAVSGSKAKPHKGAPEGYQYMPDVSVKTVEGVGQIETKGLSSLVGDAARVNRANRRTRSSRATGFRAAMFSSMEAARRLYDEASTDAERRDIAQGLYENAKDQFIKHPMVRGMSAPTGTGLAAGYTYMRRVEDMADSIDMPKTWDGDGLHKYHTEMAKKGNWMTTKASEAARDPRTGKPYIVRKNAMEKWLLEGGNTSKFLDILWKKPTVIWKAAVLAYSPRFFVNNAVGNSLMYWLSTNPASALRGMHDAYRENRNARGLDALDKLQATEFKRSLGYESQGLGSMEMAEDWGQSSSGGRVSKTTKARLKSGLYPITHKISEDSIRQAVFHHAMRKTPEYWAHRSLGLAHEDAVRRAAAIPSVLTKLRQELDNTLGNYSHLNRAERGIKQVIPFYTWNRAILRHTRTMVSERPYLAAALVRIGELGHDEFVKQFGKEIPHFLFNSIPLGNNVLDMIPGLNDIPGRETVLSTSGMNPYATVGELGQAMGGLVGLSDRPLGETVGSQMNPLAAAAIEAISGHDMISGAPVEKNGAGLIGSVFQNTGEGIPQVRLLKTLIEGAPQPKGVGADQKPLLFRGDTSQQLLSLLGLPVKRFSPIQAEEIYWRQQGGNPTAKSKLKLPKFGEKWAGSEPAF